MIDNYNSYRFFCSKDRQANNYPIKHSILGSIKQILYPNLTEDVFNKQKTKNIMQLKNSLLDSPYILAYDILYEYIDDTNYSVADELKEIESITYSDVREVLKKIKLQSTIRNFIVGNITKQDSLSIALLFNNLNSVEYKDKLHPLKLLKNGENIVIKKKSYNAHDTNVSASVFIPLGYYKPAAETGTGTDNELNMYKKKCLISIINSFLSDRFFNDLRTEEQLGYTVYTSTVYQK